MTAPAAMTDARRLSQLLRGHIVTQLVAAAVRFEIPDHLAAGAMPLERLSELTGLGPRELGRFMRALEGLGIVEQASAGVFRGTGLAALLCKTGSGYGNALMSGSDYYDAWADLDYALQSGNSAFEHRHGCTLWERFAAKPDVSAAFTRTMRSNTEQVVEDLVACYPFPRSGVVADLGAGDGTLIGALLIRFPELRGIAVEQPAVVENTRASLGAQGLLERCDVIGGDLLGSVPPGADLYVVKSVVHNWRDDAAVSILQNVRTASAASGGRVLVIERALDPRSPDPLAVAILDLSMLVLFGACDRTVDEYGALLERAGFQRGLTLQTPSGMSLLEGF